MIAMPKITGDKKDPDNLRPYIFHGVDLSWREGDKDAIAANCPFCGREGKFGVEIATSKYNCFPCGSAGCRESFCDALWNNCVPEIDEFKELQVDRKLLYPDTLIHWEITRSCITSDWLVPGYTLERKIGQLYRYTQTLKGMQLLPTPTLGHKMFGLNLYDKNRSEVYLCEGPWDAMALWEVLKETKETEEGLRQTASTDLSLLADANVLAVPGCNVFKESWCKWFVEKDVIICFDNDYSRRHPKTKKEIKPAGLSGTERVTGILSGSANPPNSIRYLKWGENGVNLNLPSGTDIRDILTKL